MKTIKQYAKENNISYEAVRKQIKTYQEELKDHITKQNRTTYLDDIATEFLDTKRQKKTVVLLEQNNENEEIKRLKQQIEQQQDQIIKLSMIINEKDQRIIDLMQEQQKEKEKVLLLENRSFFQRLFNKKAE